MSEFNKDGNLFGRCTALLTIVAMALWLGNILGVVPGCPLFTCGGCASSAAPK